MIANMYVQALLDKLERAPDHLKLDNSLSFFENFAREHNRNETSKVAVNHIVSFIQTKIHIHRTITTYQPFHTIFHPLLMLIKCMSFESVGG